MAGTEGEAAHELQGFLALLQEKLPPGSAHEGLAAHLSSLLLQLAAERPGAAALQRMEALSLSLRTATSTSTTAPSSEQQARLEQGSTTLRRWLADSRALLPFSRESNRGQEDEDEQQQQQQPGGEDAAAEDAEATGPSVAELDAGEWASSVLADAAVWEWGGVGLGELPTLQLHRSLSLLALKEQAKVRFWGKVLGRRGDYFVAEAITEETSEPDPDANDRLLFGLPLEAAFDHEGTAGPNKFTYWATTDPSRQGSWLRLPHVIPRQVVALRAMPRRYLSGALDRPVPGFPGGTEAHLLRAMLAEITADTRLSVAGLVELDEDAAAQDPPVIRCKPVEEDEDNATAAAARRWDAEELRHPEAWLHTEPLLRADGRCQPVDTSGESEADNATAGEAREMSALASGFFEPATLASPPDMTAGPMMPADLASAADDVDPWGKSMWSFRACGQAAGADVVVAKSLKWPGAVVVAKGLGGGGGGGGGREFQQPRRVVSVYVGFGVPVVSAAAGAGAGAGATGAVVGRARATSAVGMHHNRVCWPLPPLPGTEFPARHFFEAADVRSAPPDEEDGSVVE